MYVFWGNDDSFLKRNYSGQIKVIFLFGKNESCKNKIILLFMRIMYFEGGKKF